MLNLRRWQRSCRFTLSVRLFERAIMAKSTHPGLEPMRLVPVAGVFAQGARIERPKLRVRIPARLIGPEEVLFRFKGESPANLAISDGDLLIAELRRGRRTATAEVVIVTVDDHAYIGRWWAKNGKRELRDGLSLTITDHPDLKILAAVTLIVRLPVTR
jgi:hypothetical protein